MCSIVWTKFAGDGSLCVLKRLFSILENAFFVPDDTAHRIQPSHESMSDVSSLYDAKKNRQKTDATNELVDKMNRERKVYIVAHQKLQTSLENLVK